MMLLKNATILPQTKDPFIGDVLIDGKTIKAVGKDIACPESAKTIDATGYFITPGFIDAHTHIGMWEDGMGFEGSDGNEAVDPVTPALRAIDAVNPFDPCFAEAVSAGVTTVITGPGSANVIGGQFVILNTHGDSVEDMIFDHDLSSPAAMKAALGENPKRVYSSKSKSPTTRMATAAILRKTLTETREYMNKKEAAGDDTSKLPAYNFSLEAMIPVLKRELTLKIHCHRADDILTAIRIANEFNILYTLDHCTEGYMIPELIRPEFSKNLRGIIIGPLLSDRSKIELRNLTFKAPLKLYEAGIPFSMMTDSPVIPQQYLPVCASIAVREGLPEDEALRCITINPARLYGLDDMVGSIDEGKLANIAVFNGHPLDVRSRCVMTLVNGVVAHNELCVD